MNTSFSTVEPKHQPRRPHHDESRARLMAHRRERCMTFGPAMRLQFEDALTVQHQIREVLRVERITDALAVQHEIDTYAHLLPDGRQWKATLLIELPEAAQRRRELPLLSAAVHHLYVECGNHGRVVVQANEDLDDRHLGRPSAVHFLRFELPAAFRAALRAGGLAMLGCDHPDYLWRQTIPAQTLHQLRGDLTSQP